MLYFLSVHPPTHPRTLIPHRPPTSKPETMGFPVLHFRGALCITPRARHDPKLGGTHLRLHRTSPPSKKGKNTLSGCEITQFCSGNFSPFPPVFPPHSSPHRHTNKLVPPLPDAARPDVLGGCKKCAH